MKTSIIVSFIGINGTIMLEMFNQDERFHVRTYDSFDHAIARYEQLYESVHGEQPGASMGFDYRIDPRIHEVEGDDVSSLVRDDIIVMDEFRVFSLRTAYGTMIGALAAGSEAEKWHGEGVAPGLVKM